MLKTQTKELWIYGWHACRAALANPQRRIHQILLVHPALDLPQRAPIKYVERSLLDRQLGQGAVHQGIACKVDRLEVADLSSLSHCSDPNQMIVCLDQVTDPLNVGNILRSAAAFGAKAVIMTERHAPFESSALLKAASGAFERVPLIRVKNLAHTLKDLQKLGFWTVGLAEQGQKQLAQFDLKGKIALALGSEGEGLRRLTREEADFLACLPTGEEFSTLNVATAAAISLYEVARQHQP